MISYLQSAGSHSRRADKEVKISSLSHEIYEIIPKISPSAYLCPLNINFTLPMPKVRFIGLQYRPPDLTADGPTEKSKFSPSSTERFFNRNFRRTLEVCNGALACYRQNIEPIAAKVQIRSQVPSAHRPSLKHGSKWLSTMLARNFYGPLGGPAHIILALSWPVPYGKYLLKDLEPRLYIHGPWFEPSYLLNVPLQQLYTSSLGADFDEETNS
ncbi:hypothetical protein OROMI_019288 [Orobanche minor]